MVLPPLNLGPNFVGVIIRRTDETDEDRHVFSASLTVDNFGIVACGVFTMPVLPVIIVYAPPPTRKRNALVKHTLANLVGSTISFEFSSSTSDIRPLGSAFQSLQGFVGGLGKRGVDPGDPAVDDIAGKKLGAPKRPRNQMPLEKSD